MSEKLELLSVRSADSALLVIDMQNGYCHPDSAMNRTGPGTKNQQAIVPRVRTLVSACHRAQLPILWSQQVHFANDAARSSHRIPAHTTKRKFVPCIRGTWEVEFVEGLRDEVLGEDYVFEKHRATCFYNTTLETKAAHARRDHSLSPREYQLLR
jgi:ureidoacrylate peracid hydrolase